MRIRRCGGHSATGCAGQETFPNQKRLVDVFDRFGLLAHGDGQRRQPHRPTTKALTDDLQHRAVDFVETQTIDAKHPQRFVGNGGRHCPTVAHLGKVAHTAQQPVGDAGRAP